MLSLAPSTRNGACSYQRTISEDCIAFLSTWREGCMVRGRCDEMPCKLGHQAHTPCYRRGYRQNESILTAKETFNALPESSEPYSDYDIGILAEIITHAEAMAQQQARKHKGESPDRHWPPSAVL